MGPLEVLALIIVIGLPVLAVLGVVRLVGGRRKRCPQCAEPVRQEAVVCKHCGHRFA